MKKIWFVIALFIGACGFAGAVEAQQPCQWNYSFDANGNAQATYCGNVSPEKIIGKHFFSLTKFDPSGLGCNGNVSTIGHDMQPAFQALSNYLAANSIGDATVFIDAGFCEMNSGATFTTPVTFIGVGEGVGSAGNTSVAGTGIRAQYASGDMLSFASQQGIKISQLQFNSGVLRTSGSAISVTTGYGATGPNYGTIIDKVAFISQYTDVTCTTCVSFSLSNTFHTAWVSNSVVLSPGGQESSASIGPNNFWQGTASCSNAQGADLKISQGYTEVFSNTFSGGQYSVIVSPGSPQSATIRIHDNTMEDASVAEVYFQYNGFIWPSIDIADNEFSNITTGSCVQAHVAVATSGTGTPWVQNVKIHDNFSNDYITNAAFSSINLQSGTNVDINSNQELNHSSAGNGIVIGTETSKVSVNNNRSLGVSNPYIFGGSPVLIDMTTGIGLGSLPSTAADGSCVFVTAVAVPTTFNAAFAAGVSTGFAGHSGGSWVNHC